MDWSTSVLLVRFASMVEVSTSTASTFNAARLRTNATTRRISYQRSALSTLVPRVELQFPYLKARRAWWFHRRFLFLVFDVAHPRW
eukprot:scaffold2470_cov158-Amphora_coffeaeformis.AAC.15